MIYLYTKENFNSYSIPRNNNILLETLAPSPVSMQKFNNKIAGNSLKDHF